MSGIKFVLIGGGSYNWTHTLITDIAITPCLKGTHIILQDIDAEALGIVAPLCRKIVKAVNADIVIEDTTDLEAALPGADFVGLTVGVGGRKANECDLAIPARHGIMQTVGDTVGPGGWYRGLRNIPVVVDMIRKVEKLAPKAWFMNYSNPMSVITRTLCRVSPIRTFGICHELQGFMLHLATYFGIDWKKDIALSVGGINHLAWILSLSLRGHEGLSLVKAYARDPKSVQKLGDLGVPQELASHGGVAPNQLIRFDMLERTGCLAYPGNAHLAEFFQHYLATPESTRRWGFEPGQRAHTFARLREDLASGKKLHMAQMAEDRLAGRLPLDLNHSHEHADLTIAALSGAGAPLVTPVNMPNRGQIENLPRDAVVETMAYLDSSGAHPLAVGSLPETLVRFCMPHISNQEMIVEAGLTGNRDLAVLALANDPQIPSPDVAARIADDFFAECRDLLPQFNGKWSL